MKFDPRSDYSALRPEYKEGDYFDRLVDEAAKFYRPYASRFLAMGTGNHESSVLKKGGTDLTKRLCEKLGVAQSGYTGWIILRFKDGGRTFLVTIWHNHGSGGGGIITRDIISASRNAMQFPDADVITTGHTHDAWVFPIARKRLCLKDFSLKDDVQLHIKTPSYKPEYGDGIGGFAVEKNPCIKPIGCCWIRIYYAENPEKLRFEGHLDIDSSRECC